MFQVSTLCPFCSTETMKISHVGAPCPRVKAIEYYPDGTVKRVEYRDALTAIPIDPAVSSTLTT